MWYKVKRIMVGTQQVRPVIVCDFTQSDNGFSVVNSWNARSYWRNNNWFYVVSNVSAWYFANIELKIPDNIFNKWTPSKIEVLRWWSGEQQSWWWIMIWYNYYWGSADKYIRSMRNQLQTNMWTTPTTVDVSNWNPANTDFWYTVDLSNKKHFLNNYSATTQTIPDTNINNFNSYWANKYITIWLVTRWWVWAYWYLKKIKFYY